MADQRSLPVEPVRAARRRVVLIGRALDGLALLAVLVLLSCGGWLAHETLGPATSASHAGERARAVQTLSALLGPDGLRADLRAAAIDPAGARPRFERNLATARRAVAVLRSRGAAGADPGLDAIETTLARAELAARSGAPTLDTERAVTALQALANAVEPAAGRIAAITPPLPAVATVLAASLAAATLGLGVAWRRLAVAPGGDRGGSNRRAPPLDASGPDPGRPATTPADRAGDGAHPALRRALEPQSPPPASREQTGRRVSAPLDWSARAEPGLPPEPPAAADQPLRSVAPRPAIPVRPGSSPAVPATRAVARVPPAAQRIEPARNAAAGSADTTDAGTAAPLPAGDGACRPVSPGPASPSAEPLDRWNATASAVRSQPVSRHRHINPWSRPAGGSPTVVADAPGAEIACGSTAEPSRAGVAAVVPAGEPDRASPSGDASPADPAATAIDRDGPGASPTAASPAVSADPESAADERAARAGIGDALPRSVDQADPAALGTTAMARPGGAGDVDDPFASAERAAPVAVDPTDDAPIPQAEPRLAGNREPERPPAAVAAATVRQDELLLLAASLVRRTASTADPTARAELARLIEILLRRVVPPSAPATGAVLRSTPGVGGD